MRFHAIESLIGLLQEFGKNEIATPSTKLYALKLYCYF